MYYLRIILTLIPLCISIYLFYQKSRLKKELKAATQEDLTLSKQFTHRLDKIIKRNIILIIIATICGIIAALLH